MARPTTTPIDLKLPPETKRLKIIFDEFGGSQDAFATALGTTQSQVSKLLTGRQVLNSDNIRAICFKLGYNPWWLLTGEGNKKSKKDDSVKMITEIRQLKVDYEIVITKIQILEARLKYYDSLLENRV